MTSSCLSWMNNQKGMAPWTVAQDIGQLCNPAYAVSSAKFRQSDYVPNATTANGCTCSWSIYNLLSACSYCVGQYQYTSWDTWIANCGNYTSSNSYLPSGFTISQGISFWAVTNPSTWEYGVFNVAQADDKNNDGISDLTGGPIPTSTTTATTTSHSSAPVGAIVGGVIGGIAIIIIGGLFVCWTVRRHRRQRARTDPSGVPSFNGSQPVIVTPSRYIRASPAPASVYLTSPIRSTTSLSRTSLASPTSPGFSSHGHSMAPPIADAADMIAPFLATSSRPHKSRSNTSLQRSKTSELLFERVTTPPGQRTRLNPPSYSESVEPGSSGPEITWSRRLSSKKHKKRVSGATAYSGHSRASTKDSVGSVYTGSRTEQSPVHAVVQGTGTVKSARSIMSAGGVGNGDGGGSVEKTRGRKEGGSDRHPPAV